MPTGSDNGQTPIIDMLKKCISAETISFHMPGHTNSLGFSDWLRENALKIDTTEFSLTDDLNDPGEAFRTASCLAAETFGAGMTFFITTGASIAVHASLISLASPGDIIIADRKSHSSLLNACRLYGIKVVFAFIPDIPELINEYPDAALVFVTRPDYYGKADDISNIIHMSESRGMPVVVDESHGSHFCFAPALMPSSALSEGAHVVIHSAHKTLPVLTQGAMLHISKGFLRKKPESAKIFAGALKAVSTTSPSFLIAATLDYARALMSTKGNSLISNSTEMIRAFHSMLPENIRNCLSSFQGDPMRICITPGAVSVDITYMVERLNSEGIYPEFYDLTDIVLICKFNNTEDDFRKLAGVLTEVYEESMSDKEQIERNFVDFSRRVHLKDKIIEILNLSCRIPFSPSESHFKSDGAESIELKLSENRVISEPCAIYPPGIPLLIPGQIIDRNLISMLTDLLSEGIRINGITETSCRSSAEIPRFLSVFI